MPTRSPLPLLTKASDSRAAILQSLLIATIVITALYVGRDVLLPLALSILLAFVLTPPLLLLRRLKVPRIGAVAIVVAFAFAIISRSAGSCRARRRSSPLICRPTSRR
jgi:predicted PurR-regulated permease PerM